MGFPLSLQARQILQDLREVDELMHVKFLGSGVLIERQGSEDIRQYRPGQRCRKGSQEIGTQGLTAMCKGALDQAKQPTLVARRPG